MTDMSMGRSEQGIMKKTAITLILLLTVVLCAAAGASPAVSDGEITGWIAEGGSLFLQGSDEITRQIPVYLDDLLGITDEGLICLTRDQRVIAVKKDGSSFGSAESADSEQNQRLKLENGVLSLDGKEFSRNAAAAVTDGFFLYYIEADGAFWVLHADPVKDGGNTPVQDSREAYAAALSGNIVPEPLSLIVTRDALTLTGTDHGITVMNLLNGEISAYPSESGRTAAACEMNGVLYRYTLSEENRWTLETSRKTAEETSAVSQTPAVSPTSAPTATPTPTPTVAPTVAPTRIPTATPVSLIDEDGTIHRGATGEEVRKIQKRLNELGYPAGKADGKYGEKTQLAINLFCDAIHVREHNYIPPKVQKKLFAKDAPSYDPYLPLEKGDQGVSVLYMQRRLKELGYDPGNPDGIYGAKTVSAVANFQADYHIKLSPGEKAGEKASHEMLEILFAPEDSMVSSS